MRSLCFLIATLIAVVSSDRAALQDLLQRRACQKNPNLVICRTATREEFKRHSDEIEQVIPPPLPKEARQAMAARQERQQAQNDVPLKDISTLSGRRYAGEEIDDREERTHIHVNANGFTGAGSPRLVVPKLSREEFIRLQNKCSKIAPLATQLCAKEKLIRENVHRCGAFFRDCGKFISEADPLADVGKSFSSAVDLNLGTWSVNGIPYYPINEEGGIGSGHVMNIPFGSYGGGFSQNIGVRDYWSQTQEAGANWVEGKYGYKNGWSVPLVQSLGVEGGAHHTVGVPLDKKNIGKIDVNNGYNVGGYYGHNQHTGVNWRRGDVVNTFSVGSPFVNTGLETGQAVTFPGFDTWANALGR